MDATEFKQCAAVNSFAEPSGLRADHITKNVEHEFFIQQGMLTGPNCLQWLQLTIMVAYLHFIHCICLKTIPPHIHNNAFPATNLQEYYEIQLFDRILLHIHNFLLLSLYFAIFQVHINAFCGGIYHYLSLAIIYWTQHSVISTVINTPDNHKLKLVITYKSRK